MHSLGVIMLEAWHEFGVTVGRFRLYNDKNSHGYQRITAVCLHGNFQPTDDASFTAHVARDFVTVRLMRDDLSCKRKC